MSNLNDLKALGDELVPIVEKLFALPDLHAEKNDTTAEAEAIKRLRKVTLEANQPTRGDLQIRAEALISSREALTEILVHAKARTDAISSTKLRIVEAQHNALGASFGRLLEQSAFAAIPSLLDDDEMNKINDSLARADREIQQRKLAKDILALTVDIALMSAKIAARIA